MSEYLSDKKTKTQISRKSPKGRAVTEIISLVGNLKLALSEVSLRSVRLSLRPPLIVSSINPESTSRLPARHDQAFPCTNRITYLSGPKSSDRQQPDSTGEPFFFARRISFPVSDLSFASVFYASQHQLSEYISRHGTNPVSQEDKELPSFSLSLFLQEISLVKASGGNFDHIDTDPVRLSLCLSYASLVPRQQLTPCLHLVSAEGHSIDRSRC